MPCVTRSPASSTSWRSRRGQEGQAPAKPAVPRDLLMEMMELQEALEEAKDAGLDEAARERLRVERGRLLDRRAATEAAIVARGADWDAAVDAGRRPRAAARVVQGRPRHAGVSPDRHR